MPWVGQNKPPKWTTSECQNQLLGDGAEDSEGLVLLTIALQLAGILIRLRCVSFGESLGGERLGLIRLTHGRQNARFGHQVLLALFDFDRFVGALQTFWQIGLGVEEVVGGVIVT